MQFLKGVKNVKRHKKGDMQLVKIENFLEYKEPITVKDKTFEKLMFIYSIAIRELETKIGILQDESKIFYDYDLIDHVSSRIKKPESIMNKMEKRGYPFTYQEMIENINDIAGIRIICPLKKDVFSVKDLIKKIPGIHILKEKDYVTNPKESGYSSYHMILEVPVTLSQNMIYVKVELQIRTLAMDFWANLEHKIKYKPEGTVNKKVSKELVSYAKAIHKLDNKMMLLNN